MSIRDIIEKQVRDLQARVVDLDHIRTYFRLFGPYDIEGVRHVVALMEAVCEAVNEYDAAEDAHIDALLGESDASSTETHQRQRDAIIALSTARKALAAYRNDHKEAISRD